MCFLEIGIIHERGKEKCELGVDEFQRNLTRIFDRERLCGETLPRPTHRYRKNVLLWLDLTLNIHIRKPPRGHEPGC